MINNNNGSVLSDALSQAIAAIERRVSLAPKGQINMGNKIIAGAFAGRFPSVNLTDALVAGAAAGRFVLTGIDKRTVRTNEKHATIKADTKAKNQSKRADGQAIAVALENAKQEIATRAFDAAAE